MKYLTPAIFESKDLLINLKRLKEDIGNPQITCTEDWKQFYGNGECCGKISFYIIRKYINYWNFTTASPIKEKLIYIYPFCDAHKPKKCRKLTIKEIFYIKIC
jgi:hypothetical protein